MHGQIDLAAPGEVLDVAVAAVLGPSGDGAGALPPDPVRDVGGRGAGHLTGKKEEESCKAECELQPLLH